MTDILWHAMQHISDDWIMKADEDAVRKHFQMDSPQEAEGNGRIITLPTKPFARKSARRRLGWLSVAACFCICVCAALFAQMGTSPGTLPRMEAPIMEVTSTDEMREYLGYPVPVLEGKTVTSYLLNTSGEYAETGSVLYSDGSSFQITRENTALPEDIYYTESINGVPVQFGWEDGHQYATWTHNGYSCRYYDYETGVGIMSPDVQGEPDYTDEISSLILQLNKK